MNYKIMMTVCNIVCILAVLVVLFVQIDKFVDNKLDDNIHIQNKNLQTKKKSLNNYNGQVVKNIEYTGYMIYINFENGTTLSMKSRHHMKLYHLKRY